MKTKTTKFLSFLAVVLVAAGLLAVGEAQFAIAAGSPPSGTIAAGVKDRVNGAISEGYPLSKEARGAKVFGADSAATLVTDEKGNVPTTGGVAEIAIAGLTPGAVPQCYLMLFDSSVAADTTESGAVSRMLVPPLSAVTSGNARLEFSFPKQFHKGLVALVGGVGAASCRATVSWIKNGGTN